MGRSLGEPLLGERQQGSKGSVAYCSGDPLGKRFWVESRMLWKIAGPAIFSRLATFGMNVITQAFAGHLGDLELAAISISMTVVVGFNFGLMVLTAATGIGTGPQDLTCSCNYS